MNRVFPIISIFSIIVTTSILSETEKIVLAKIYGEPLFFEEIFAGRESQQEIGYTDRKKAHDNLRQKVINHNLIKFKIQPTQDQISAYRDKIGKYDWGRLGKDEETRENTVKSVKGRMAKLNEILDSYKKDPGKNYDYWKDELTPLGISERHWNSYIGPDQIEEILRNAKRASVYDKKKFFEDRSADGQRFAEIDLLKKTCISEPTVNKKEISNLFDLVSNINRIDLHILFGRKEVLDSVQKWETKLSEGLNGTTRTDVSLTNNWLNLDQNNINKEYIFLCSIYLDNLSESSISQLFMIKIGDKWQHCKIFVDKLEMKDYRTEPPQNKAKNLENQIVAFKRDHGYQFWLDSELSQNIEILHDGFRNFFTNINPQN